MPRPTAARRDLVTYPYSAVIQTRWRDLDKLGHINNVSMAGLVEEGRGAFNRSLALTPIPGVRWLIANVDIAYVAEAFFPGDVVIGSGILRIGDTSWTIASGVFQREKCVAIADTVLVYTDADGKAALPPSLKDMLATQLLPMG
jgi:acyl-CoA thioester hydrolase